MTEKQVDVTQHYLDLTNKKVHNMEKVLNTYEYPSYTRSKEEYVQELDNFFNMYGELEFIRVDVLPYRSEEEIELVLEDMSKVKSKVKRLLNLRLTYYSSKDSMMLMPIWVLNENYVAKVTTMREDIKINDIDANIINMFLMVYTLAVKVNIDDEGGVL
jgi:tRNA nucleotidyltransferase/poly(A) polymerase